ncbi:UDP-glucuronosyltransferase 2B7-like isoform X2 [Acanthaster planci]|uniref:UDP-glucuronosyltransferase 2B7-like isoform X2 n=1 Tax=Acanthaster planci TaxID=133434 RepID=A0A8B8A3H4_ACAPL|nr:UDP-glucuronosyltransferase 2B7-like isoform X2 [Acanthaster planci]
MSLLFLFLSILFSSFALPACSSDAGNTKGGEKYKFLYFASIVAGSHYINLVESGRALARKGHHVVSVVSSSNPTSLVQKDADLSLVVFNSSYTKQDRDTVNDNMSEAGLAGQLNFLGFRWLLEKDMRDKLKIRDMYLQECDDLFSDSATMKRLQEEKFDMLVGDDYIPCSPMLAQALDIPFVLNSVFFAIPTKHAGWTGLPVDPSYIPERVMGLTDRMTFLQRLKNVLGHFYFNIVHFQLDSANFVRYDKLKDKYNIKPEISTLESHKQALLYFMHGSFGLEFPRPLQPNIKYVLYHAGLNSNQMMDEDVAKFLDTAPDGVVFFALSSLLRKIGQEQGQIFADAFASLPYRVLWKSNENLTGIRLGNNTMVAKGLPMMKILDHVNVRVYVVHGGAFSTYEAMWEGVPMVGIPLWEDQMDNVVRVEAQGAGLKLDISGLKSETLSRAICRVMTEPGFRENAQRVSKILRDLQNDDRPADKVARWILHVTRFGGDHLRPAVMDLNYVQRNLLDVYLFIGLVLASVIMINVSVCYFCCRSLCRFGRGDHFKKE